MMDNRQRFRKPDLMTVITVAAVVGVVVTVVSAYF